MQMIFSKLPALCATKLRWRKSR